MTPGTEELPTEMGALVLRCEQATGPDREIDRIIFAIARPAAFADAEEVATYSDPSYRGNNADWRYLRDIGLPRYTASLDAAMTLVPAGWHTELALQDRHSSRWKWALRGGFGIRSEAWAETAALSMCVAALRARAHLQANPATSDSKEEGR